MHRLVGEAGPEAVIPLHKMRQFMKDAGAGGGGGPSVNIVVNGGGGMADLSADQFGAMVQSAVVSTIRNRGGMRALIRETSRSAL